MYDSEATIQDVDIQQRESEIQASRASGCQHAVIGKSDDIYVDGFLKCGDCGKVDTPEGFGCAEWGR